jgi:hypothetical protein
MVVVVIVPEVVVALVVTIVAVVVVGVVELVTMHPHLAGHTVNATPPRSRPEHSSGAIAKQGGGSSFPLHRVAVLVVVVVTVLVAVVMLVVVAVVAVVLVVDVVHDPQRMGQ